MSEMTPLLIEIGTEEIPAGVAPRMGEALQEAVKKLLTNADIKVKVIRLGITPRRLLLYVPACPSMQEDREETIWGPPERIAFKDGEPGKAAEGFANKLGLSLADCILDDKGDGKGRYIKAIRNTAGRPVADIIANAMPDILRKLPSPKTMRWQDGKTRNDSFIRPVRWIVARLGNTVIPFSFANIVSGKESRGHRIHGSTGELDISNPFAWLQEQGVIANREQRIASILEQLESAAKSEGVTLVADEDLLQEVADLTEWPQVVSGRYDKQFLRLPPEVSRIELKHHQRCFASRNLDGSTSNVFFAVANIASANPSIVADGNVRVVNARLADAAFYFDRDPKDSLETRVEKLNTVVFQEGLGMVGDQVRRIRTFVLDTADKLNLDANVAQRAAYLCKSDLSTGLVGEFPELQGYMGGIYARIDGEQKDVATAIAEHYLPASADDALPESPIARAISIAERVDKLLGYFHIGRIPTASADPFGLRRSAIGLIRLLADEKVAVNMSLKQALEESARQWNQQRITIAISNQTLEQARAFILERLLGMADSLSLSRPAIEAAIGSSQDRPLYKTLSRARKLMEFIETDIGQAVAEVHKRTYNILKKNEVGAQPISATLFEFETEKSFYAALKSVEAGLPVDEIDRELHLLASLREPVNRFFTDVMVMVDNPDIRNNRLALLGSLHALLMRVANFSRH
ncbi:MAG: glycine--tRNA ligase subunit beta [Mariprofundaceae bacterium]